ncbi:Mal regulon transcriptional regulator MalI [Chimaeribacter arupi]|uniref:Mal regulon transcriptional regulator MalI n=2 Tax=Yersiniaceae TaxID=1903411 RepID=A0A2N5ESH7_9GAMM|nr:MULTISPECIES: Mal regulon transcriptional regulator MalI [Yersiniaceae]MBS0971359.1 Mal regulon transcriptional regulator MalI [Nissabacter archeti]MDV5139038.1 Mal regulon transcriptional regulator MalI [Chimaeribacter arupi]PLR31973.1 Mal regulon transcriptional regulator MalI [Chimaeribacter arupi]PLR45322.1 Mal regulon transcriptional regulator MalI [Chimaeribacter arupi]PLR45997.1 Mal regulon transcriptional regulator MalI [Chimaeribacter arupi]
MTPKKITINDVADHAGVSVTTVSLVVSGKGRISPQTAARVQQAIQALGYVPNRQAVTLRGGRSGVIGLIVRDVCDPFYAEVTAGLSEVLEAQARVLFLTQSGREGLGSLRAAESLLKQGVDGIVLAGNLLHGPDVRQRAAAAGVPLVCAARANALEGMDLVRPDNQLAARLATGHLVAEGHKQIAYIGGAGHSLTRAERLGGFCATLLQYGLPFRPEWMVESGVHRHGMAAKVEALLRRYPQITALVCHDAAVTLGAYFGVLNAGRNVGGQALEGLYSPQVALAGFGEDADDALAELPLTRVSAAGREVGRSAAERLLQRIDNPDATPQQWVVAPVLIARAPG